MFGKRHKTYTRPRKAYDKVRIEDENSLVEKYGLKNKREIWKADAHVAVLRNRAKALIGKDLLLQKQFLEKLQKFGFKAEKLADVLALDKEDLLKRRLQSVVLARNLASTPRQARQLIVHKHVTVGERVVNIPSYLVLLHEESKIMLRRKHGN